MTVLRIGKLEVHDFRCFKDISFRLGKRITAIAGHNATGKSTILGLLGHCAELKMKSGTPILWKQFRTEFREIIKATRNCDRLCQHVYSVHLLRDDDEIEPVSFRTAWQDGDRFRIIPKKTPTRNTEKKIEWPTLYLGLSRLYPIGESENLNASEVRLTGIQKEKFFRVYKEILSMNEDPVDCSKIKIQETNKKVTVGIKTANYEPICNSAGQDNLSQILLAVMSFESLKEHRGEDWDGGLLLIDELDATLHPAAQNKLIKYLSDSAEELQIQIVFTTHSLSMLEYVCEKCSHNLQDESNNFEIVYLTNRNGFLELMNYPTYETIYNDMLNTLSILSGKSRKIAVWTEDDEARWFLKGILGQLVPKVDLLNVSMGHNELLKMLQEDYPHFRDFLFVLDGDVSQEKLVAISRQLGIKSVPPSILRLPGGTFPEKVLYDYLADLNGNHELLREHATSGLSLRSIKENGPDSYRGFDKERDKYKKWFSDFKQIIEIVLPYWMNDHENEVQSFISDFAKGFNQIATRINLPRITS